MKNGANMKKDWVEEVGEKKIAAVLIVQDLDPPRYGSRSKSVSEFGPPPRSKAASGYGPPFADLDPPTKLSF